VKASALVAAAAALLLASWSLTHHTSDSRYSITDTGLYEQYGDRMTSGDVPYRDFELEYPPLALPVFVLPSLGHERDRNAYDRWFDREMALAMLLLLLGVALITNAAPVPLLVVAASPLLIGPVVLSRFDAWPTALAILALAAFLRERLAVAAVLLGAAIAAKLWPFVLLPLFAVRLGRRRGPAFAAGTLGVAAAFFLPFFVLAPRGVWHTFHEQLFRPLQLESLGGALLVAAHHVLGTGVEIETTYGSQNIAGSAAGVVSVALTVALAASLVVVWARARDVVAGAAACVTALLAFGKVFSPQFVVWLVPFVAVVPDVAAILLLIAALVLTQTWFPRHYWDLALRFEPLESWELLARDLVVVALFVLLAMRALRRAPALRPASAGAAAPVHPARSARLGS
jgi:hypothetical protein